MEGMMKTLAGRTRCECMREEDAAKRCDIRGLLVEAPVWRKGHNGLNEQYLYRFANGYGASVIRGEYTYGGTEGLWELGVIRFTGDGAEDWGLTYKTPITEDVIGHLDFEGVAELLVRIATLPAPAEGEDGDEDET